MARQVLAQSETRSGGARRRTALALALLTLVLVTGGAALANGGTRVSLAGYGYGYGYGHAPTVTTDAASLVTPTSATLNATVNPEGQTVTDCYFEYGRTEILGHRVPCEPSPGSGEGAVAVAAIIGGLEPNTTYHFMIVATNVDGTSYGSERTFNTLSGPLAPPMVAPPTAPTLSGLSQTAKTWREGNALAQISANESKTKKKLPIGTTFSFSLNEPASVTFTFTEPASGRKVGKKCVAQTKKNKHKHRCTRTAIAGALTFSAHAGTNRVRFDGLISRHKKLKPGNFTLLITATVSGKHSTTRTLNFTIANG